jgi:hypothetical protein
MATCRSHTEESPLCESVRARTKKGSATLTRCRLGLWLFRHAGRYGLLVAEQGPVQGGTNCSARGRAARCTANSWEPRVPLQAERGAGASESTGALKGVEGALDQTGGDKLSPSHSRASLNVRALAAMLIV